MAYYPLDAMKQTVYRFRGDVSQEMVQGSSTSYGLINMDKNMKNGACKAFSYYWLWCRKNNKNFWRFILSPSGIVKIRDAQAEEQSAGTSFDRDWVRPNTVLTKLGFTPVREGMADIVPFRADAVAAELVKNPGYKLISIRGSGGGHAICGIVTPHDADFFDPNAGEATFFSAMNLGYWFVDWWKNCEFYKTQLGDRALIRTYRYGFPASTGASKKAGV